ncbi:MAG: hypothetical protein IJE46_01340 [Clostridia bacterium]|nr:hypothetical protein [Clostridia bacterium]
MKKEKNFKSLKWYNFLTYYFTNIFPVVILLFVIWSLIAIWGSGREVTLGHIYSELLSSGIYVDGPDAVSAVYRIFNADYLSTFIFKTVFIVLYAVFIVIFTNYIKKKMQIFDKVVPKLLFVRFTVNTIFYNLSHSLFVEEPLSLFIGFSIVLSIPYLAILIPNIVYFRKRNIGGYATISVQPLESDSVTYASESKFDRIESKNFIDVEKKMVIEQKASNHSLDNNNYIIAHVLSTSKGYYTSKIRITDKNKESILKWKDQDNNCIYITKIAVEGQEKSHFTTKEVFEKKRSAFDELFDVNTK